MHTMRAVLMFDCCHRISAQAAVVALCLNPVSMVINWGSDGVYSGAAAAVAVAAGGLLLSLLLSPLLHTVG